MEVFKCKIFLIKKKMTVSYKNPDFYFLLKSGKIDLSVLCNRLQRWALNEGLLNRATVIGD